jgi:hypothetical protein
MKLKSTYEKDLTKNLCPAQEVFTKCIRSWLELEVSCAMQDAEINDVITKLYEKVDTYSAEDLWYFDVPLAIRLRKRLLSR